jgi:hypothetical protein
MWTLEDDNYKSLSQVNPFDETVLKTLNFADMKIFWSIDMRGSLDINYLRRIDILKDSAGKIRNEDQVFFDGKKIRKFFELNLMVGEKVDGQIKYTVIPFVNCNLDYYKFLGKDQELKFENRLCPDEEMFKKHAKVKGGYSN